MGAWGYAPWDDDSAADWFGDLFDEIPLAKKVEETLNLDPEEDAAEIRAAASLLVMLGRTYVWPIDDIERHLQLAITQMEKVRAVYEDESRTRSLGHRLLSLQRLSGVHIVRDFDGLFADLPSQIVSKVHPLT